ncbi:MAG: hypothetical protein ACOCUO_03105 [archaeon]
MSHHHEHHGPRRGHGPRPPSEETRVARLEAKKQELRDEIDWIEQRIEEMESPERGV